MLTTAQVNHPIEYSSGTGCGADFLLCLACRNAYVHHGHYPRLAHLHRQLQSLRSALPDRDWNRRWISHTADAAITYPSRASSP
jgi:hypothetical protein